MSLLVSLYAAILFFVLTPGILISLPKGGKKFQVAGLHALVFAVIFHFTHKLVWRFGVSLEGMTPTTKSTTTASPTTASPTNTSPQIQYYTDKECKTKTDKITPGPNETFYQIEYNSGNRTCKISDFPTIPSE
jgi:hypothetical protein